MQAAGTTVRLHGMQTTKFNHHLAVVLPTPVTEDCRTAVRLLTTDHVPAHELNSGPGTPPSPMSVRSACLRAAWPFDQQRRVLLYGCAHERVILRALQQCGLPPECAAAVITHLEISSVDMSRVAAVACSSSSENGDTGHYTFSMQASLEPGDSDCWISAQGAALHEDQMYAELLAEDPGAPQFDEWLVYSLTSNRPTPPVAASAATDGADPSPARPGVACPPEAATALLRGSGSSKCQVHRVSIRIPAMPHGPLSIRRFYLQAGNTTATMGAGQRTWKRDQPDPIPVETTPTDETDWGAIAVPAVLLLPSLVRYLPSQQLELSVLCHVDCCAEWGACSAVFTTLDVARLQHFAVFPPLECEAVKLVCIENAAGLEDERVGQYESIGFWEVCFG